MKISANQPLMFKTDDISIDMKFNIVQGEPYAKNTIAQLIYPNGGAITKEISAGTAIRWQFLPFDAANNKIVIDTTIPSMSVANFIGQYVYQQNTFNLTNL